MARPPPHKHSSASIKEGAKVLVIGAGRIGCEVLKTLALSGCQDIHIIDKGFVEVSDLNGQFLFRQSHVGKLKAEIAQRAILELRPGISITSHHGNIKDPHFDEFFFKQFDVVLIGIDNFDAVRHVNRLCLQAKVPLIDSWTVGFLGQVTVHVNGLTECYECRPKPAAETYSVCTITSTPSEFVHCMVWAKDILFVMLFGNKRLTDDWNGDSSLEQAEDVFVRKNDEDVEQYGRRIYDHVFGHNIEVALSNEETWDNRCRPKPIYSRDALPNDISQHNRNVETHEHAMASLGLQNSRAVLSLEENSRIFLEALKLLLMKKEKRFGYITFDKHDQLAVEFVTAAANIRACAFGIPLHSLFEAKGIVGNIVPAVATTNAIIAGLIANETVKVLQNDKKNYRMTYCVERCRKKMMLVPVKPLEPNKFCYVCSKTPLLLEINTNSATLRDIAEKVVKNKLGLNTILIMHEEDILYVDGIFLDRDIIIKSEANVDKVLSELLSPVTSGTMLVIEDDQQGLSCNINIKHREDFDEEKEPDGMVLSALTQPTFLVKDDEKFNANARSTSNASELEADKNNEIEIALGIKRKWSEVSETNSDDSADESSLSNEGFNSNELNTVGQKLCGICGRDHHDSFDARRLSNKGFKFNERMAVGGKGCRVCGSDQHHPVNCPLLTSVPPGSIVGPDYLVICSSCSFELCQPTPNWCFQCGEFGEEGQAVEASMVDESFRDILKDYTVVP